MESPRERTLKTLHAAATEIQACESVEAACERTVDAAEVILEFEMCSVLLHEDGWLDPVALSSGAPADGARRMSVEDGLAGKTYRTGESYVVDAVETDDETDPAKDAYRSGLSVPIGDVGVFQAVSTEPAAFDDADVELAELLVTYTARAVDRIRFERELRASRESLRRQKERLEEFTSAVSHDLRSPLNVAEGRLEMARAERGESDHLDAVGRAHDRMETLIDDLLRLAREGDPVDDAEPVDLGALARESWRTVRTADAALVVETDATIRGDRNRLARLLENLLRNAVEHGSTSPDSGARRDAVEHGSTSSQPGTDDAEEPGGAAVTVTVGDLGDGDGFYVADDGPGVPPDEREAVFRRGYSTAESGTGFGLAIVREIVTAHGWDIRLVESDAGGARFEITGVERTREAATAP